MEFRKYLSYKTQRDDNNQSILLTVTWTSSIRTEVKAAFPLQKWLCDREFALFIPFNPLKTET
jgi:hypothetical protein